MKPADLVLTITMILLSGCAGWPSWPGGVNSPIQMQVEPWRPCSLPLSFTKGTDETHPDHIRAALWAAMIWEDATGFDGFFSQDEPRDNPVYVIAASTQGWSGFAQVGHFFGCIFHAKILVDDSCRTDRDLPFLTSIYVHEIGHILGLSDHWQREGVMYWQVQHTSHPRGLAAFEVEKIKELYGLP